MRVSLACLLIASVLGLVGFGWSGFFDDEDTIDSSVLMEIRVQ